VGELRPDTPSRGTFTAASGEVEVDLGLEHTGRVQWLDVTDHAEPSDDPILLDAASLAEVAGTAYVVVRPVGELTRAFGRWQGAVLDRLDGAAVSAPAAHATIKAFGSATGPVTPETVGALTSVAEAWAATTPPIELRVSGFALFDEEDGSRIPVVTLDTDALRPSMRALWAAAEGLPRSGADAIGLDAWIAHLSLAYPSGAVPAATWGVVEAWMATVEDRPACVAAHAELLVFDGGPGRRVGRWPLAG